MAGPANTVISNAVLHLSGISFFFVPPPRSDPLPPGAMALACVALIARSSSPKHNKKRRNQTGTVLVPTLGILDYQPLAAASVAALTMSSGLPLPESMFTTLAFSALPTFEPNCVSIHSEYELALL